MRRRRWRLPGAVVTTTAVALSLSGAGTGSAAPQSDIPTVPTPTAPAGGATTEVTLITGDVVEYTVDRNGERRVALAPASTPDRLGVTYFEITEGDSYYVYPSDALPLIDAGRLDRSLFDVELLVRSGYDDQATDELPVIAQYGAAVRGAGALASHADALPASSEVTALPSVRGAGFEVDKDQIGAFWKSVAGGSTTARTTLNAGLSKLWLDQLVRPTLEQSTAQIGAPTAWADGYDGTGTTVAVLDTGIDLDHPDLADRVVTAANFTPDESVHDGFGHGTHVASIIAGSGAASDGKYRGVAPGASLMIGKVLRDHGTGSTTDVLAGMEWAAANGADVVNMSLGSGPTDGTDLKSTAVNTLTAQYGTLFVVAAGNSGPNPQTVGSPGSADAALTVAAVDRDDRTASFSSRGPRLGDHGLKPDLAAPGVRITAARSDPSIMGGLAGDRYLAASGTSMAAPHVAGAAALLAQRNPEWTASELKPVLVSTATNAGNSVFEQGAGRVDVPRALRQRVYATNNLSFGAVAFDQTDPVHRSVTLVNRSDRPVTLDLSVALSSADGPAPAGMIRVSADQVTVAANGTTEVTVVIDPTRGAPTWYEGVLRASADGIEIRAAIGIVRAAELFDVTGKLIMPDGALNASVGGVFFTRDDNRRDRTTTVRGARVAEQTVRLNAGPHTFAASVSWFDEAGFHSAVALAPEFQVTGDTTVTLDLRELRRVHPAVTPRDSQSDLIAYGALRAGEGDVSGVRMTGTARPAAGLHGWMLPTKQVTTGSLDVFAQHVSSAPSIEMSVAGRRGLDLHPRYHSSDAPDVARLDGRRTMSLVDGGTGTAAELAEVDARGALVLLDLAEFRAVPVCTADVAARVAEAHRAGAAAVLGYGTSGHAMLVAAPYAIPTMSIPTTEARALLARLDRGRVRVDTEGFAVSPYRYHLAFFAGGQVPEELPHRVNHRQVYRVDNRFHADAPGTVTRAYSGRHNDRRFAAIVTLAPVRSQSTATEYFGPVSADLVWDQDVSYRYDEAVNGSDYGPTFGRHDVFARPGHRTQPWNSRPLSTGPYDVPAEVAGSPWVPRDCLTCRAGDTMVVDTNLLDPSGNTTSYISRPESYRLTRDGQEFPLKERGYLFNALFFLLRVPVDTFDVPADLGTYRLEHRTTTSPAPQLRYGRTEDTAYTFRSRRPTARFDSCIGQRALGVPEPCGADRILRLRYDTRLDLTNRAEADESQRISVSGFYGNGLAAPRLRSLQLWASADDGRTWQRVRVHQRHGQFTGTIHHPELADSTGAITLRAKAVDVDGNTVDQTLHRAYGLK